MRERFYTDAPRILDIEETRELITNVGMTLWGKTVRLVELHEDVLSRFNHLREHQLLLYGNNHCRHWKSDVWHKSKHRLLVDDFASR